MTRLTTFGRITALVGIMLVALLGTTSPANAQDVTSVTGSADFRNPPQLVDGRFQDTIVTGETVWYSVVYSNETPYRFAVTLPDADPNDASVGVSFVRPNLQKLGDRAATVEGSGSHEASHTNLWYLTVDFDEDTAPGVSHRVLIDVQGVEETTLADCTQLAECTFDRELAEIVGELASAEDQLGEFDGLERSSQVQLEINNLNGFLETAETLRPQREARLAAAESDLARFCAPEPICDAPSRGSSAPIWAVGFGLLVLIGGAYKAVSRFRSEEADAAIDGIAPVQDSVAAPEQPSDEQHIVYTTR